MIARCHVRERLQLTRVELITQRSQMTFVRKSPPGLHAVRRLRELVLRLIHLHAAHHEPGQLSRSAPKSYAQQQEARS